MIRPATLSIGDLAAASGCKVPTIRYYETAGLVAPAARTDGNQRRYRQDDLERLCFVRRARDLGFSLDAVRDLLALSGDRARSCEEVDRIARAKLVQVERKIGELQSLRRELGRMLEQCRQGTVADCEIIAALAATAPDKRPRAHS